MKLNLIPGKSQNLINTELKSKLLETKNKINPYYNDIIKKGNYTTNKWDKYRSLLNKYETIPKGQNKLNRAYFKLKELILDDKSKYRKIKTAATLAEGPGGFIEFLTDYFPKINVYGITLKYDNEELAQTRHMKKFKKDNIKIIYGDEDNPTHNGNLYVKDIVDSYARQVGEVDLVTADGGFQAQNESNKEIEHVKLFLAETLAAFKVLKKGGSYILKIYDVFTKPTLELLFLLSNVFKSVELKKPVSSRPANSERYVVCHGFKGFKTNIHVGQETEYESILSLKKSDKKRFDNFVAKLEKSNEQYVKGIINNIEKVLNFINVNDSNGRLPQNIRIEKEKEQQMFKEVWEKVYAKRERRKGKKGKK